jgi:hypothetical protein
MILSGILLLERLSGWCHATTTSRAELGFAALLSLLFGAGSLATATRMTFTRATVHNFEDPDIFTDRNMVDFISQSPDHPSLLRFRGHIEHALTPGATTLQTAVILRKWVRTQQPESRSCWYPRKTETEDPEQLLEEQHKGVPGACRRLSYILTGALVSAGLNARLAAFGSSFNQRCERSHSVVEVWCGELGKWVLLDPTYDTLIRVNGVPASAFELYRALRTADASLITFDRDGSELAPGPCVRAYKGVCRHIFVAQTNALFDGYRMRVFGRRRISFAHFVEQDEAPYPELRKRFLFAITTCCLLACLVLGIGFLSY